ncbi:MAG: hypothetical protein ACKVS9_17680 [Phycisphaerae bacterium]
MQLHLRSAFHIRTGDRRLADSADEWLRSRGFDRTNVDDVYDACTQLIAGSMVAPAVVLVGLDHVHADELAILDYLRKLYPDATMFAYGIVRGASPARNVRGVSVAADWTQLECLLAAWQASRERHLPSQREPIFDDTRSGAITALRELRTSAPTRGDHVARALNGLAASSAPSSANGTYANGTHASGSHANGGSVDRDMNGIAQTISSLAASVAPLAPDVERKPPTANGTHTAARSPIRAVLTLAERAALLGLEPARG